MSLSSSFCKVFCLLTFTLSLGRRKVVTGRPSQNLPASPDFHAVFLRWKEGITNDEIAILDGYYERLKTECDGVMSVSFGKGSSAESKDQGFDDGTVITFTDQLSLDKYMGCIAGPCYSWTDGQKGDLLGDPKLAASLNNELGEICDVADELEFYAFGLVAPPSDENPTLRYDSGRFAYDFTARSHERNDKRVHVDLFRFKPNVRRWTIDMVVKRYKAISRKCGASEVYGGKANSAEPFDQKYDIGLSNVFDQQEQLDAFIGCLDGPCFEYNRIGRRTKQIREFPPGMDAKSICVEHDKFEFWIQRYLDTSVQKPDNYFSILLAYDFLTGPSRPTRPVGLSDNRGVDGDPIDFLD